MTSKASAAVLVLLGLCASSCRQNDDPTGAADLLSQVQEADYRSWARAPGYDQRQPAFGPHGEAVDIYVNDTIVAALGQPGTAAWPEGSIVVKDAFDSDGGIDVIAIIEKRSDGWYWAEYDDTSTVLYSGAPSLCTDCHSAGSDFMQSFALP